MTALLVALLLGTPPGMAVGNPGWGNGTYCGGYQMGFTLGWCADDMGICPNPPPPPCPPPVPGKTGYADGQVRGYEVGKAAKAKLPKAGPPRGMQ